MNLRSCILRLVYLYCFFQLGSGQIQNPEDHNSVFTTTPNIIDTSVWEFPWLVSFIHTNNSDVSGKINYLRSGVLIHPAAVISGSYKYIGNHRSEFIVLLGKWWPGMTNLLQHRFQYQERRIKSYIIYPRQTTWLIPYGVTLYYLDRHFKINWSPNVGVAYVSAILPPVGTECLAVKLAYDYYVKKKSITIHPRQKCEKEMSSALSLQFNLDSSSICASNDADLRYQYNDGQSILVCPTVIKGKTTYTLYGLSALNINANLVNFPGVYNNIAETISWIDSQLELHYGTGVSLLQNQNVCG